MPAPRPARLRNDRLTLSIDRHYGRATALREAGRRRDLLAFDPARAASDLRFGFGGLTLRADREVRKLAADGPMATVCARDEQYEVEKRYGLVDDLPCVSLQTHLRNHGAQVLDSVPGPFLSLRGVRANDKRFFVHPNGDGAPVDLAPVCKATSGYTSRPSDQQWLGVFDARTRRMVLLVREAGPGGFQHVAFPAHVTVDSRSAPVGPGQECTLRRELWALGPEDLDAVAQSRLLGRAQARALVRALTWLFAPEQERTLERLSKRERFRERGGRADCTLSFVRLRAGKRETLAADARGRLHVPAGSLGAWRLAVRLGAPVAEGGAILLRRRSLTRFAQATQTRSPREEDYLAVRGPAGARLAVTRENVPYTWVQGSGVKTTSPGYLLTVEQGRLRKGDKLQVTVGAPRPGRTTMMCNQVLLAEDRRDRTNQRLDVYVDPEGDKTFLRAARFLPLTIPAEPHRLVVAADSTPRGRRARVVAKVEDLYGNLCADFAGEAVVRGPVDEPGATFPIRGGCGSCAVRLRKGADTATVCVDVPEAGLAGESNPMDTKLLQGRRAYWGEMHGHTSLSHDGKGGIDAAVRFGRDAARLDFCAITDHTRSRERGQRMPERMNRYFRGAWWTAHRRAARRYAEPGVYVPVLAQEIHPGDGGDHDVYHPSYGSPVVIPESGHIGAADPAYNKLYRFLRKHRILIIPHVGGGEKDWRWHDPQVERCAEVASIHGRFESFVQGGLQRGYRLGMVYGSDNHGGTPGHSGYLVEGSAGDTIRPTKLRMPRMNSPMWTNGTTAVLARSLTLEDVLDALWQRRCYAVVGRARPLVDFRVNGRRMGDSLRTRERPHVDLTVRASVPVRSVHIIRNQYEAHRARGRGNRATVAFEDKGVEAGTNYYYARVVLAGDQVAWTSPVWVTYSGRATPRSERPWNAEEVPSLDAVREDPAALEHKQTFLDRLRMLAGDRFHTFKAVRVGDDGWGPHALFFGLDRARADAHVRCRYFYAFERPLIQTGSTWTPFDSYPGDKWLVK